VVILAVHHRVRDYDAWKPVFDEHEAVRRRHGEIEHRVYRVPDDPNRLVIHNDFPSLDAARGFMDDPSLPEVMSRAGVEGEPGIGLATRAEQKVYDESAAGQRLTLVVWHKIRDFDAWKPAFDEHEPVRRRHGEIEHRVYQMVDDPNTVIVHNDFPSREAAQGLMDDPSLPEAMEKAGLAGEPWLGFVELVERKVY
jgi:quinol monooxygenase YgiN